MAAEDAPTVVLVPLDERPVSTALPAAVAAIGGVQLELPPADLLPRMRSRPDPDLLLTWLADRLSPRPGAKEAVALVVSLDGLVHGGLIASRTSDDSLEVLASRLGALGRLAAPGLRGRPEISAFGTVTRASDSFVGDEEPSYWPEYGRALHAWGAAAHRIFDGVAGPEDLLAAQDVPREIRRDFQSRRLRNHLVDLEALRMRAEGRIDRLLITADDTATHSAGSVEQRWLEHWRALLGLDDVSVHPGADEVAAVLLARHLVGVGPPVRIMPRWADEDGMRRVAPFENRPYAEALRSQVEAAGAVLVDRAAEADALLVVHPPGAERADWCAEPDHSADGDDRAARTAKEIATALAEAESSSLPVGLVDARQTNGGDPALIERISAAGHLLALSAYGGWNTAGNATGSTVATLVAAVIARRHGIDSSEAIERQLVARVTEDVLYQSIERAALNGTHGVHLLREHSDPDGVEPFAEMARKRLDSRLARITPGWRLARVRLPWGRSFEVDLDLVREH